MPNVSHRQRDLAGQSVTLYAIHYRPELLRPELTRELSLFGSCASAGEYPACLDLMARGALDPTPLLSAVAPLREGATWFKRLHARERGLLKVVLVP